MGVVKLPCTLLVFAAGGESSYIIRFTKQDASSLFRAWKERIIILLCITMSSGGKGICSELNAACGPEYDGFFGIEIEHDDSSEYMIAVASTLPESDNLKEYTIPACTWAVFPGKNFFAEEFAEAESAIKFDERLYSEWLPTSGYEIAGHLDVHLLLPTDDFENAPFERWLPVKKLTER